MKLKMILVAALLPVAVFAQQSKASISTTSKTFKVHVNGGIILNTSLRHFSGKAASGDITVPGSVDLDLRNSGSVATGSGQSTDWSTAYMQAREVTISCAGFPDLSSDTFQFDNLTQTACLSGHVRITDHGATKEIGEVACIDLSGNTYRILSLK